MDSQTLTNKSPDASVAAAYFSPDDYLLKTLQRAVANNQDIHISTGNTGSLTILSSRGEYFTDSPDLRALLCQSPDNCRVRILGTGDHQIPPESRVGRNIDELMWQAAFYVSDGRLMEGCNQADVIQLDCWPNLTRLPHTPNSFRILALLSKHPTSVFFASRLLKVPASEIYQIYSAAKAAGLSHAINRKAEEPRLEPHRSQSLLSSLLNKIGRF
ncbi:MAG: hypothetical protein HUJ18_07155 [Marinobacter sp.]|nr:hypothetical protein [Marinobacter sp.]